MLRLSALLRTVGTVLLFPLFPVFGGDSLAIISVPSTGWDPFGRPSYATSSFAEDRGSRYHAGIDLGTEMEQGWPILAPEEGEIERIRIGPFFYGKNLFYRTASGKVWLFAHLSGFPEPIASDLGRKMERRRLAGGDFPIKVPFRTGDTIAFAGKTGIGNPHLHIELRNGDLLYPPTVGGMAIFDSLPPALLEVAHLRPGGGVELFDTEEKGAEPIIDGIEAGSRLALRIVDYSRHPRTNPMSVARLSLRCPSGEPIYEKRYDSLRFGAMEQIRQDLLWARRGKTSGDWHFAGEWKGALFGAPQGDGDLLRCLSGDSGEIEVELEDFAGHRSLRRILLRRRDLRVPPPLDRIHGDRRGNQDPDLFTFLSRPFLSVAAAEQIGWVTLPERDSIGAIPLDRFLPSGFRTIRWTRDPFKKVWRQISLRSVSDQGGDVVWEEKWGKVTIPIAPSSFSRVITAEWREDSPSPYLELHPKGVPLLPGRSVEACLRAPEGKGIGLFWRSEGSLEWNGFSRTRRDGKFLCTSIDEVRDLSVRIDTLPPEIGKPTIDTLHLDGKQLPALSFPIEERGGAGFAGASSFTATLGKKWIYAEYNMTDRRLRIPLQLLEGAKGELRVEAKDEFGNRAERRIKSEALVP